MVEEEENKGQRREFSFLMSLSAGAGKSVMSWLLIQLEVAWKILVMRAMAYCALVKNK